MEDENGSTADKSHGVADAAQSSTDSQADRAWALELHKSYLEERKSLNEAELAACESYDKHMIALSSGALGLSIFYLEKVAHSAMPESYVWLYVAWAFFGTTLCVMLFSFLLSQSSWSRQREILDREQMRTSGDDVERPGPSGPCFRLPSGFRWVPGAGLLNRLGEQPNPWATLTKGLNWVALGLFVVGVIAFVRFSVSNLPREGIESMSNNESRSGSGFEQKGAPARPSAVPLRMPTEQRGSPARPNAVPPPSPPKPASK